MIAEIIIILFAGGITSAIQTYLPALKKLKQNKVLTHRIVLHPVRNFIIWTVITSTMLPLVIPSLLSTKVNNKLINSLMELKT